ncbi:MAG: hypothetical protein P8175_14880, partial [Deltaproteobacteria bacterium]
VAEAFRGEEHQEVHGYVATFHIGLSHGEPYYENPQEGCQIHGTGYGKRKDLGPYDIHSDKKQHRAQCYQGKSIKPTTYELGKPFK